MAITLTEGSAREIRKILTGQPEGKRYLRIGIKGGGCAGFTYSVDLCAKPESQDVVHESLGVKIVCDRVSNLYLDGTMIDFQDDALQRGFVFNNPNAGAACECGASFDI